MWGSPQKFLLKNELYIAISNEHFAEIYYAKKIYKKWLIYIL